jgi:hypothetical protein
VSRAALATLALVLAGCGLLRVEERAIPSVAGAVAATAWQSQEPTLPDQVAALAPQTDPAVYLDRVVEALMSSSSELDQEQHGLLSREGDTAVGYVQVDGSTLSRAVVAFEVRLTLTRRADGSWRVSGVETRQQCAAPLRGDQCAGDDNSGG